LNLIVQLINLYGIALFARVILSWFPIDPSGPMASIFSFLYTITEPVLAPVRRMVPAIGGLDLSPLIVFFALRLVAQAVAGA
jgi:YggT family protein